ncbi:MAG: hypothetical protein AAEJ47_04715 [Planctomycetota bacterium]
MSPTSREVLPVREDNGSFCLRTAGALAMRGLWNASCGQGIEIANELTGST